MKFPRRQFVHLAAVAAALPVMSRIARAQAYPARPVRLIVPAAAGGSTDSAARVIGEYLSRAFGQQVYIENRSGAGGNIGIEAAVKSLPDGYTILVTSDYVASSAHVFKLNIDPLKDLMPVIQLSRQPVVLAVHPSLEINSIAELVTLAKQQPGLNYAVGGGAGSQQQFVVEWFAQMAGIKFTLVTYRGGGPAINDLIGGHVKIVSLGSTPLSRITRQARYDYWRNQRPHGLLACRRCRPFRKRVSMGWCLTSGSARWCPHGRRPSSSLASMRRSTRWSPTRRSARASCNPHKNPSAVAPTSSPVSSTMILKNTGA
jgi:Tripartite tricarboxylate transporter family receptor